MKLAALCGVLLLIVVGAGYPALAPPPVGTGCPGGPSAQRIFFAFTDSTIDGGCPSSYMHGWSMMPRPAQENNLNAWCWDHATFTGFIDGVEYPPNYVEAVDQGPVPGDPSKKFTLCRYHRTIGANTFSVGTYIAQGQWCTDVEADVPPGCYYYSQTLTVN